MKNNDTCLYVFLFFAFAVSSLYNVFYIVTAAFEQTTQSCNKYFIIVCVDALANIWYDKQEFI